MATPKRRISHSRTHNRKAKFLGALNAPAVTKCKECGEPIQSYTACPKCGMYRGRKVLKIADDAAEE